MWCRMFKRKFIWRLILIFLLIIFLGFITLVVNQGQMKNLVSKESQILMDLLSQRSRVQLKDLVELGDLVQVKNFTSQENSVQPSAFAQAKQNLLDEQKLIQEDSERCTQRFGTELINNYHRAHIHLCTGLHDSNVSCYVNTKYKVPRMLCVGNNGKTETLSSKRSKNGAVKKLLFDCDAKVYEKLPPSVWHKGPLARISTTDQLSCTDYVEHPVFVLSRYDYKNIYHVLEDVVTTYESLLVLDLDPINVELVIWDDFPYQNTLFQIWKTLFGKGVRVLNETPFERGICFRQSIFNIYGDNSLLSHDGGVKKNTICSSPILKSLRHFFYQAMFSREENEDIEREEVKLIGFISRQQYDSSRTIGRVIENEIELLTEIKNQLPVNWRLVTIRPEVMDTFKEQVQVFKKLDVLIGVHGAGLANIMFMKSGTHLIEIFYRDRTKVNRHYHNMCKWLGINYYSPPYFSKTVDPSKIWTILAKVI